MTPEVASLRSVFSKLFTQGQVIPTDRGRGIFQPALDTAISKLNMGHWVHLFPEGYVNLSRQMVLRRFKWGLSRLLLEAEKRPRVIPIWIEGFDQIMPDPRNFPKFLPRPFAKLHVHFGEPIDQPGTILDTMLTSLRKRPSLNPLHWAQEDEETQQIHAIASSASREEAPEISIPKMSSFPAVASHPVPKAGWPDPPMDSLAYKSQLGSQRDEEAMKDRSRLAEVLRRELAWLGVKSRRDRGEPEGEVGELVHGGVLEQSK